MHSFLLFPGIKFQCPECQKVFSTKGNLSVHMKVHEGVQFTCEVCSKTFNFKSNFNFHMKQHMKPPEKRGRRFYKKIKEETETKRTKTKYTQFSSGSMDLESKMMCDESDTEIQNQNVGQISLPSDDRNKRAQGEAEDINASLTDASTHERNDKKGIIGRNSFAEVSRSKKYIVLNTNEMATRLICKMEHHEEDSSNEQSSLQSSSQDGTADTCANYSENAPEISPASEGVDMETAAYNTDPDDEPVDQEGEGVTIEPEEFLINCKRPVAVHEKTTDARDKTNDLTEEDIEKIVCEAQK